jgi:hypothetical protein
MRVGKNFSYGIIKDGNSIYKGAVHHGVKNGEGVLVQIPLIELLPASGIMTP